MAPPSRRCRVYRSTVPFLGVPKHTIAFSDIAAATVLPSWDKEAEILNLEALLAVQTKFHGKTAPVACPKVC